MNLDKCLAKMVAPGTHRRGKYREGVIQIHVTRACDKACFACTQGSNLGGKTHFMPTLMFEAAVRSLGFGSQSSEQYFGVVGVFGGNPAMSPHFEEYCEVLRQLVPYQQRGVWSNNPISVQRAREMRRTFDPAVSNLNVHLDQKAWEMFREGWPEAHPVGLHADSRHSPVHLAAKDVVRKPCPTCGGNDPAECSCESGTVPDYERIWQAVSSCDINQHWSAMLGMFRNSLRAWFCEVAGAQAILHQDDPEYPDTGVDPTREHDFRFNATNVKPWLENEEMTDVGEAVIDCDFPCVPWWKLQMHPFKEQVRKHCPECAVPLRGYGELSQAPDGKEVTSETHRSIFKAKRAGREVVVATELTQLGLGRLQRTTDYMGNAKR